MFLFDNGAASSVRVSVPFSAAIDMPFPQLKFTIAMRIDCESHIWKSGLCIAIGWLPLQVALAQTAASAPESSAASAALPIVDIGQSLVKSRRPISIGPMPGLNIGRDQIPANLQSATKEEIKASHALNIGDYMNTQLQGVSVNDYSGNPFQMDVNYRGFTASPQAGTPQGLSVFFDGVRVNEPFGDVVNWDLIPLNAIDRFDLFPGSNPLFGLNTLGGAIALRTKSGFTAPGIDAEFTAGSWGRKQLQLSGGGNNGTMGGFAALTRFDENGWRDNSPSRVNQFFTRGDLKSGRLSANASLVYADNRLIGNGLIPLQLFQERPETVFTSPDRSVNRLSQLALAAQWDASSVFNITGQVYHRRSNRNGLNGDVNEGFDDLVSADGGPPEAALNGAFYGAPGVVQGTPIGILTTTRLSQSINGGALQLNWNLERHAVMVGASIDHGDTGYGMTQRLGLIDASHNVYADAADIGTQFYAASHDIPGNTFSGTSQTRSLFFNDTWSPRKDVTLTTSARYNTTRVSNNLRVRSSSGSVDLDEIREGVQNGGVDQVNDQTTTKETFTYKSFNPAVGLNWLPQPGLNLFTNVSRGARAPSVIELGCAFDSTPVPVSSSIPALGTTARSLAGPGCSLPTTLSGDPYLPQIRSTSYEVGARGQFASKWEWNTSVFRTDLTNDIYFVGVGQSRSYFDTIGKTRRQGLEAGVKGSVGPFDVKLDYAFTSATFQSQFYLLSPHNSSADFNQADRSIADLNYQALTVLPGPNSALNNGRGTYHDIRVDPGARMPGIPAHTVNANMALHATADWKIGLGMQVRSLSYVRGNENNLHRVGGTDQEQPQYYCSETQNGVCVSSFDSQTSVRPGRRFTEAGTVGGFATFRLDTSYQFTKTVSAFLQVNNLLDRRYATAGSLGVNPFSPSTVGAIGPSGWNYNSAEWENSTFVGPSAPRGIFVGINYALDGQ